MDCVRIIDKGEYCGICYEISSTIPKDWVLCDLVIGFFLNRNSASNGCISSARRPGLTGSSLAKTQTWRRLLIIARSAGTARATIKARIRNCLSSIVIRAFAMGVVRRRARPPAQPKGVKKVQGTNWTVSPYWARAIFGNRKNSISPISTVRITRLLKNWLQAWGKILVCLRKNSIMIFCRSTKRLVTKT